MRYMRTPRLLPRLGCLGLLALPILLPAALAVGAIVLTGAVLVGLVQGCLALRRTQLRRLA